MSFEQEADREAMTSTTTYTLSVNLSASQTRKRLKGHGFGVRKVEAADRNQAIIVHTATGQHLRDLEAFFADVMPSDPPERECPTADSDAGRGGDRSASSP
jgi:hypothetical protein